MVQRSETVIDLLLETGGGGAGRHVLDLHTGLLNRGWCSRLIVSLQRADPNFLAELEELDQRYVGEIPMRRGLHWSDIPAARALRGMYRDSAQRRLLHAHSTKAGLLGTTAAGMAAASVYTPHAYRAMDPTLALPTKLGIRGVEALFSRAYDRIIAVSRAEFRHAISMGIPENRVRHIPNGVDYESLNVQLRPRTAPGDKLVIGFIGRLVYQKNPELFLEVLARVRDHGIPVSAIIVGEGPLRARMMRLSEQLGIASLLEWRDGNLAIQSLADMDVVVHTSRYESFPYTLLEAAATLTPIVAVRNFGSEAILSNVHPRALHEGSNPADIADAVAELLVDDRSRTHYIEALGRIRARYSIDTMVDDTVTLYEELLQTK